MRVHRAPASIVPGGGRKGVRTEGLMRGSPHTASIVLGGGRNGLRTYIQLIPYIMDGRVKRLDCSVT
jgi:hypothetical protein